MSEVIQDASKVGGNGGERAFVSPGIEGSLVMLYTTQTGGLFKVRARTSLAEWQDAVENRRVPINEDWEGGPYYESVAFVVLARVEDNFDHVAGTKRA